MTVSQGYPHINVDLCTTQKNRSSHFSSKGELHQWNLEAAGVPQLQGGSIYDICPIGPVVGSGHLHPRNVTIPANPSNHNLCCQSKLKLWVLTGYTKKCINGPPKLDTLNLFQDFRGLHCAFRAFQPCCHPPSHQPAPDQSAKALMDSPPMDAMDPVRSHLWPLAPPLAGPWVQTTPPTHPQGCAVASPTAPDDDLMWKMCL